MTCSIKGTRLGLQAVMARHEGANDNHYDAYFHRWSCVVQYRRALPDALNEITMEGTPDIHAAREPQLMATMQQVQFDIEGSHVAEVVARTQMVSAQRKSIANAQGCEK